jgi:hypothetical protein
VKTAFARLPKTYGGLARLHMPRPIHDDAACANATKIADALAGHELNRDQEDYYLLLCDLIEAYEKETQPPDPVFFLPPGIS